MDFVAEAGWPPATEAATVAASVVAAAASAAAAFAEAAVVACAFEREEHSLYQPSQRVLNLALRPTHPHWHHVQVAAAYCETIDLPWHSCASPCLPAPWRSVGRPRLSCAGLLAGTNHGRRKMMNGTTCGKRGSGCHCSLHSTDAHGLVAEELYDWGQRSSS